MTSSPEIQGNIKKYLLGQLAGADLAEIERRVLTDDEFYEEVQIMEDELVDEYVNADLSAEERRLFEKNFLADPESRNKLRLGRALDRHLSDQPLKRHQPALFPFLPFRNPIVSYSLAAAVLVIVGVVSWVAFRTWRNSTPREPGKILAIELTPGLTRDEGEIKKFAISPGTDSVELELRIVSVDQYQSYRAVLQTTEGSENFRIDGLRATTKDSRVVVPFRLAAGLLSRGDYYVKLSGLNPRGEYEDVDRYTFRITNN